MRCALLPLLLAAAIAGCDRDSGSDEHAPADAHAAAPHWSYDGVDGPALWAQLSADYATCGTGGQQSPIEIAGAAPEALPPITFRYTPAHVQLRHNGHTVQASYEAGSFIEIDGHRYDLLQMHFHHPSEHVVEGRAFDLELHLVHRDSEGKLAVVGVLIDSTGTADPEMTAALTGLPQTAGSATEHDVDPSALLPLSREYFTYEGSLTTPPCTEGVRWLVLTTPVSAAREVVDAFATLFPVNARPPQPLVGRTVRVSAPAR